MKRLRVLLSAVLLLTARGAWSQQVAPPTTVTADQDHRRLLELLKIDQLRRGPSGNPNAPDHANSDESKATPYPNLPDPLKTNPAPAPIFR